MIFIRSWSATSHQRGTSQQLTLTTGNHCLSCAWTACACGTCEILTTSYLVCFVLPLVLSPHLAIHPPAPVTALVHSLYGKRRPHMVRIMWFEWSDQWQTHPECLQTCSCSSKKECQCLLLFPAIFSSTLGPQHPSVVPILYNSNKTPANFQYVWVYAEPRPWLLEPSDDSAACRFIETAKLPCLHSSCFLWMVGLVVSAKEASEESSETAELPGFIPLADVLNTLLHKGHKCGLFLELKSFH